MADVNITVSIGRPIMQDKVRLAFVQFLTTLIKLSFSGADYILAGEIVGIDLPSVSWDGVSRASGVNVKLAVRYVLKDLKSGKIVWEVPRKLYTADYTEKKISAAGDELALREIVDDIAEDIYMGTLHRIRRQQAKEPTSGKGQFAE